MSTQTSLDLKNLPKGTRVRLTAKAHDAGFNISDKEKFQSGQEVVILGESALGINWPDQVLYDVRPAGAKLEDSEPAHLRGTKDGMAFSDEIEVLVAS